MSDSDQLQLTTIHSIHQVSWLNIKSHSVILGNSFTKMNSAGMLQFSFSMKETSQKPQVCASLLLSRPIDEAAQIDSTVEYLKNLGMEIDKETERRRRKGLGRKGKVPWNKGKKHSAETRELIKKRTTEALKDPKVRRKMVERQSHTHSTETRAKMVLGQKRAWTKRLRLKNSKDRYYNTWGEGIAESAKKGWFGQAELEWDGYEKIKSEIDLRHLQRAVEIENTKKTVKLIAAREKSEWMEIRAQRKKEKEEKEEEARSRREARRKLQLEAKKRKQESSISSKLQARITKIRLKKSINGKAVISLSVTSTHEPAIEKLDLEFMKRDKAPREISFADKIQAAKQKKAESSANGLVTAREVVTTRHQADIDFDLEVMETEKLKAEVPLADRMQAAKLKRPEATRKEHVNGHQPGITMKREKPKSKLSFSDQIRAAKQKRADSSMKESVNGQVSNAEDLATSHKPATTQRDLEITKREKAQDKLPVTDQSRAAKQRTAGSSMKVSIDDKVNGQVTIAEDITTSYKQDIKRFELDYMKREESQSTLSFAEQIRAAKQRRAESAMKESTEHHSPVSS